VDERIYARNYENFSRKSPVMRVLESSLLGYSMENDAKQLITSERKISMYNFC
jgi:hypothetical protein